MRTGRELGRPLLGLGPMTMAHTAQRRVGFPVVRHDEGVRLDIRGHEAREGQGRIVRHHQEVHLPRQRGMGTVQHRPGGYRRVMSTHSAPSQWPCWNLPRRPLLSARTSRSLWHRHLAKHIRQAASSEKRCRNTSRVFGNSGRTASQAIFWGL